MGRLLFLCTTLFLLGSPLAGQVQERTSADTSKINGNIAAVKTLVASREFHTARGLLHNIIENSLAAQYPRGVAWGNYYLGKIFYETSEMDSAVNCFNEALIGFKSILDRKAEALVCCQLGKYYRRTDSNARSVAFYQQAIYLAESIEDAESYAEALYGMGTTLTQQGHYTEAMEHCIKAISIWEELENKAGIAEVLNNMGVLFWYQGDYTQALDFFLRSLNLRVEANDPQGVAYQHNNIGLVLRDIKEYDRGIGYLRKSWEMKVRLDDKWGISNSLMNIGSIFLLQNKYDSALVYLDQAGEVKEQVRDRSGLARVNRFKGELYRNLKQHDKSLEHLAHALSIFREMDEPRGEAEVLVQMALTYFEIGQESRAFELMSNAERIARISPMIDIRNQVYKGLYDFHLKLGDCAKSLFYYQRYVDAHDSIVGQSNLKKLLSLQLKAEYESLMQKHSVRTDGELMLAEKQRRHKTWLARLFMAAFGLTVVVLGLFLYAMRNKQRINRELAQQKQEVEHQKQALVEQRDELEIQKNLVIYQRDRIMNMLTELGESIDYAKKIQQAILPSPAILKQYFVDHFTVYQPKESVGGDFYWVGSCGSKIGFAAADCTGHGVPGGFMSMLGMSIINDMVTQTSAHTPATILGTLRQRIINALGQKGDEDDALDGMDIALCTYDKSSQTLTYAGANSPIVISTSTPVEPSDRVVAHFDGLVELRPDRMPISYFDRMDAFSEISLTLSPGDTIYLFSDGFVGQFGGDKGKKFGYTKFRAMLNSVRKLPLSQQKQVITTSLEKWMGETENQTDDILVMGVRLS